MGPGCKGAELWIIRILRVVFSLAVVWIPLAPEVLADNFPEFTQQPKSHFVSKNHSVTLTCSATPDDVHIRWLYNGEPLDLRRHLGLRLQGSNLVFQRSVDPYPGEDESGSDVTKFPGNAGEYRCTATNDVGTIISAPAFLTVPVLEEFQTPAKDLRMRVPPNGYVTLTCDTPHSLPPADVIWVKDDDHLVDPQLDHVVVQPSGNLVISRLSSSSTGSYRCTAVNPVSGVNKTSPSVVEVVVDYGIQGLAVTHVLTTDKVRHVQVAAGSDVTLECPSYGLGWDDVTWSKYRQALPKGRSQTSEFGTLRIYRTQHNDNGTYKCGLRAGTSSSSSSPSAPIEEARVYLEVVEVPSVLVTAQPDWRVEEGVRVSMRCELLRGYRLPNLTWFHNGRQVARYSKAKGDDGTFVLNRATPADSGIYQCVASNEHGTNSSTLELKVMARPGALDGDTGEETPSEEEDDFDNGEDSDKAARRDRKKLGRRRKLRMRERRKKKKGDKERPKYAPSVPAVTQLSDRTVMLNWTIPDRDNGQTIKFFKVQYREMSPKKSSWQTCDPQISSIKRIFEVGDLKTGGTYKFRVLAVYEDDDNRNSDNTPLVKMAVHQFEKASVPDTEPIIVEVKPLNRLDQYGIGIKWQYKAESVTPIEGFVLLYRPYGIDRDQELVLPGANIRNHVIIDLEPSTNYQIRMQSFNDAGRSGYSNQVVAITKSRPDRPPMSVFPPVTPKEDKTEPSTSGRHSDTNSLEQPVILGIVLGALLLALAVLVTMCWWKQHQHKRRNLSSESHKFQDQSHCIYSDAIPPQHTKPNGGLYPHMPNGNTPTHDQRAGGGGGMSIDINPLAEYDLQTAVHSDAASRGKPPYFSNGVGNENVGRYRDSGEMMYMEDGQKQPAQGKGGHSIQHRTLPSTPGSPLSSFYTGVGSQTHEYSEPNQREFPKSPSGHSHSPHPMQGVAMNSAHSQGIPHPAPAPYKHVHHPHHPPPPHHQGMPYHPTPPRYGTAGYDWSAPGGASYEHVHGGENPQMGRHTPVHNFRGGTADFENNPLLMYQQQHQQPQPLRYPGHPQHAASGSTGVRNPNMPPPLYYKTVPVDYGQKQQSGMQASNGRHKKRKKRQNSRDAPYVKETGVRDQATNTDLSSNEGTIEFTSFGKSGSSSNSVSNYDSDNQGETGAMIDNNHHHHHHHSLHHNNHNLNHDHIHDYNRDSSFANNGSLESVDESVSQASDYDTHHRASTDYSLPL